MKRISVLFLLIASLVVTATVMASPPGPGSRAPKPPHSVYNAVPKPLPPNVASVGFEATSTSEFGDYVHLADGNRVLKTVTVTMSDWALYSDYAGDSRYSADSSTWTHPVTVNIYSNHLSAGVPDQLLATVTETVSIPWRPVADPTCPGGTAWRAGDHNCYNGLAFNAKFDFSDQKVTLPDDVIVGVAYNTADYGATPIHLPGPYNSLNVGVPTGQTASVGDDDNADNVFWNTSYAGFYADGGAAGVGTFRQDSNWTPNGTLAVHITASPLRLKLDRESISAKGCQPAGSHPKLLVNVHGTLVNDYDSGFAGNAWANDTIDRHLRIWQLADGTFCAQVEDDGNFVTFAGASPSGTSTVGAGVKGDIDGGYVTTFFTGTYAPTLATKGDVGTFDLKCTDASNCPGARLNPLRYLSSTAGFDLAQWGWIYHADKHGTWLNQDDVAAADSGDIT